MKFVDLSDEAIEHARKFERLPAATRKLVKESVEAAVKDEVAPLVDVPAPSIVWGANDGTRACLTLVVRGFVNAN